MKAIDISLITLSLMMCAISFLRDEDKDVPFLWVVCFVMWIVLFIVNLGI